ncbi:hypothetical protein [Taibaiella koreensis]|uniref:hypothetical protein n=1 Tax=Taibaiella koreensis TaxID=1268548 RepID=UPI000E59CAB2|nr:hypothetical protein [Taibaiella koreensis]
MDTLLNRDKPEVRLRAFRAIDDPETCYKFAEGHMRVLTNFGIENITSSKNAWIENPGAFVIIVESLDRQKVYGGARIHVAGGSQPLPIEDATGTMDPYIYDMVTSYGMRGTGEGCGLWNSREIAGYGIGSIFLSRAGVAIAPQIGLTSLFALCAPYTVKLAENIGYRIERSLGNEGTFYYPKLDLLATAMLYTDLEHLSEANEDDRTAILSLRDNLNIVRTETLRRKEIMIHYDLSIPGLERWSLDDTIQNLKQNYRTNTQQEGNLNLF